MISAKASGNALGVSIGDPGNSGEAMLERIGRVNNLLLWTVPCLALFCALGLGSIALSINSSVQNYAALAQIAQPHPNDDAMALIEYVRSEQHSLDDGNHAIWALGRLRDSRALPLLEDFYTGEECAHDTHLCQHELQKAIVRCTVASPK